MFGAVERPVSGIDECARVHAGPRLGKASTDADERWGFGRCVRKPQITDCLARPIQPCGGICDPAIRQQDREFLAAIARNQSIIAAEGGEQRLRA